ncbi:MAG: shikimate kinase [Eggerthellaceae bacterium]|nr:shikimate kinase [Eggerthellaceae bacterium]
MAEVLDFRNRADSATRKTYKLVKPVFLVGFMGAGKTSTARKLARNAGVTAIDMDTYIERRCDKKVKQIFAESGEAGFRAIETDVLRELAMSAEPQLVSCGGGVVLAEENRRILKEHGFVVYLQVTADEAASRISNVSTRPLFGDLEQARRVIAGRLPLYEEVADTTIDTAGRGSGSIAREVFARLRKEGILEEAGQATSQSDS